MTLRARDIIDIIGDMASQTNLKMTQGSFAA